MRFKILFLLIFFNLVITSQAVETEGEKKLHLYYFVSFSMPEKSLKNAVEDAEKIDAILVLRGMKDDSMTETMKLIEKYIGKKAVQFQIDPVLFQEFDIETVPALALIEESECQSCGRGKLITPAIYGDVRLFDALTEMKKYVPVKLNSLMDQLLKKLKKSYYEK